MNTYGTVEAYLISNFGTDLGKLLASCPCIFTRGKKNCRYQLDGMLSGPGDPLDFWRREDFLPLLEVEHCIFGHQSSSL
jgi:hypothetical protein